VAKISGLLPVSAFPRWELATFRSAGTCHQSRRSITPGELDAMSTSFHNLSNTGARAKRTHARRSCDLCKIRKTRCELPDLDIPSSSDALPTDKACHRCKVLALPCVVEDSSRKQRKRSGEEAWTSPNQVAQSSPKRRLPLATSSRFLAAEAMETNNGGVNHSLDLIHGFHPADATNSTPLFAPSSAFRINPDQQAENGDSHRVQSMRFHGRPLVLVCAMLRVAYGKNEAKISRQLVTPEEVDLGELADHDMRARLEPGYACIAHRSPADCL